LSYTSNGNFNPIDSSFIEDDKQEMKQAYEFPEWFKTRVKWWNEGKISNLEFYSGINTLQNLKTNLS